jgi:DNA-directed RNA polymerase specialized sigma24 family protein
MSERLTKIGGDRRTQVTGLLSEPRSLAQAVFSGQNPAHTLQPTALVHEDCLKLAGMRDDGVDLVALDDCLSRLSQLNQRHAKVVELRLFSGLSINEKADVLGVSSRSVDSDWAMAKAWLCKSLA